jgi:hypothetical protein
MKQGLVLVLFGSALAQVPLAVPNLRGLVYPNLARSAGTQGTVHGVAYSKDGKTMVEISGGHPLLVRVAQENAATWDFRGWSAPVWFEYQFTLTPERWENKRVLKAGRLGRLFLRLRKAPTYKDEKYCSSSTDTQVDASQASIIGPDGSFHDGILVEVRTQRHCLNTDKSGANRAD